MFLGRLLLLLSESNAENSQKISVCRFYIDIGFDQSLPFLHHGSKFVRCQIHSIELGQTIFALNFLTGQFKFLVWPFSILKYHRKKSLEMLFSKLKFWYRNVVLFYNVEDLFLKKGMIFASKVYTCSFCKSAKETSYTRPFNPSEANFVPWVRLTKVFPTSRTLKTEGALISYQSLRVKGSTTFFLTPFLPVLASP